MRDRNKNKNIDKKSNRGLTGGRIFSEKEDDAAERKPKGKSAAEQPSDIMEYNSYWDMEC